MTKEDQAQALLKKYLNKQASPAEIQQVESWYASFENQTSDLDEGRKKEIGEEILLNLRTVLGNSEALKLKRIGFVKRMTKIAAAIVLISGLALSFWSPSKQQQVRESLLMVSTASGQKKKMVLPDGSEIVLGPSAKLLYPAKFNTKSRTVILKEGEAFFDIAHEEHRPFIVKTNNDIYTKVLGTSFRIKTNSRNTAVAVMTGKVAVGNARQVFGTLIKGQQIDYDQVSQRAEISYTQVKTYVNINFESTPLQEVLKKLEYAYSIRIELDDASLKNLKCTASFNTKQSPEEILEVICSLHHLKLRKSEDHQTFNVYRK